MTKQELIAQNPDLYNEVLADGQREFLEKIKTGEDVRKIFSDLVDPLIASGVQDGAEKERKRIAEITALAVEGQEAIVAELVEKGTEPGEAAKTLLADLKNPEGAASKKRGLREMAASDPGELGANRSGDTTHGDEGVSGKIEGLIAQRMKEKPELKYRDAYLAVMKENKELAEKYATLKK